MGTRALARLRRSERGSLCSERNYCIFDSRLGIFIVYNKIIFSFLNDDNNSDNISLIFSSTAATSCTSGVMTLVNAGGSRSDNDSNSPVLSPGQCITLKFSGTIAFGRSGGALVPYTLSGRADIVHVIASKNAEMKLSCTLPLSKTSCKVLSDQRGQD
jgi:hypothetical protein